jgi:hypothetical protein
MIRSQLTLRHASKRRSGTWGPNDYDLMSGDHVVGRIFFAGASEPTKRRWKWAVTGAETRAVASEGFAASREEARAVAEEYWRKGRAALAVYSQQILDEYQLSSLNDVVEQIRKSQEK